MVLGASRICAVHLALGPLATVFSQPVWTWFTLFIGFNCLQSAFTRFCPPAWAMRSLGLGRKHRSQWRSVPLASRRHADR
ncbi:MAG: DUF2892 domain-containing protein [Gammaproteobacteria bacterium]